MISTRSFSFATALSLTTMLVLNLLLVPGSAVAAITDLTPSTAVATEQVKREPMPVPTLSSADIAAVSGLDQKSLNNALFLLQIQNDLKSAYKEYHDLNSTISQSEAKVLTINETIGTLREQIISFQHEIDLSEEKIRNVAEQIGLKERELTLLEEEVKNRGAALEGQKKLLADYMRVLYIKENRFSADGNGEVFSSAKLILADENVGDTLREMTTLDMLQHSGQTMLEALSTSQQQILEMGTLILQKKQRLDDLRDRLLAERQNLQSEQQAKAKLLEITHGEQQTYQKLVEESQKQQDESILQINALQSNFNYIKDNLSRLGNSVQGNDLQKILDDRTKQIYDYQQQQDSGTPLQWPIKPSRGISAFYHDTGYKSRFGVAHQAVDIPTNQATQIHAPKDGIVYKTKDNGMGYSYIILSHKDKLMTVYGHVSSILVKEGQVVKSGDIIGLTGGMPGTKGAGYMTTGPHLHFEVLKNGEHVDPLDYLSLTKLSLDSLPEKYSRRVEEQRAQEAQQRLDGQSEDAVGVGVGVDGKSADQIDSAVEQSGQDEIDVYRRLFGIPKDSGSIKP